MLADFDAQPGRDAPPPPELSPTQREADEAELAPGSAEWPGLWPAPKG